MKTKGLTILTLMLVVLLVLPMGAGAQEGRTGEPKTSTLSLQSVQSTSIDDTYTPTQLANLLVGSEVTLSGITFTGSPLGSGYFSGFSGDIGLGSGLILGSGKVIDVVGPNTSDATTTDFGLPGDSDLNNLIPGYTTYDATILEFDFECPEGTSGENVISFRYVFSSEEYNEYVNSTFNDVFGFFLNGTNIALLPDGVTPVSINNVNNGFSSGGGLPGTNPSNPAYYINNDLDDGGPFVDIEADGLTVVLGAQANINPGVPNHIRLAIADAGDHVLDSWVFIEEGSFKCAPLNQPPTADRNGPYLGAVGSSIPFDGTGSSDPDGDPLTYNWDWGDGTTSIDAGSTPSHSYSTAGIFDVCLTVTDPGDLSNTACTITVVYDPDAGFVTGGGWISSPEGAYKADMSLVGKANFGFVSKYKKGSDVPEGNTEFQFTAGDLNFHSSSYDWLVVTGGNYARYKGSGTINGEIAPNSLPYKFMIWAGDGTGSNGEDTFRIKIWWEDADGLEHIVYDNGMDQAIGGGSIVVHAK